MRPGDTILGVGQESFPRVSGDAPRIMEINITLDVFSPRERGCARGDGLTCLALVVFPA